MREQRCFEIPLMLRQQGGAKVNMALILGFDEPREVADLVANLSSEQVGFLTGGYCLVDGGYSAQ